ncbi:MAG: HDIG domain-containing protein [Turicibacter sp.]|nr:HDIG domain-containing protein [Turicibacter sp.]
MNNRVFNGILIVVAFLITCIAVFTSQYFQSALVVSVGDVAMQRVAAPRAMENVLATARNREEALARSEEANPDIATFLDTSRNIYTVNNIYNFFNVLDGIRGDYVAWNAEQAINMQLAHAEWLHEIETWNAHIEILDDFDEPVLNEPSAEFIFETEPFNLQEHFVGLPPLLSPTLQEFLLNLSAEEYTELLYNLQEVAELVLEAPGIAVVNDFQVAENLNNALEQIFGYANTEEVINRTNIGRVILMASLEPNRVFDANLFHNLQQEIADNYETVTLAPNQTIVALGEPISEEAFAMMEALGMFDSDWTRDIVPLTGIFIILAAIMLTSCWFIFLYRRKIISQSKEGLLIFTLYSAMLAVLWLIDGSEFYLMPILAFTMLIAMLVDSRTGAVLNLGFTIIAYFVAGITVEHVIFFMLSGSLICLLARNTTERNKIMMVSLLAAFFNFILAVAIVLAFEPHQVTYSVEQVLLVASFAAINGVLAVIISIGSLPLWEVAFGVVTPIKILDLTNPTSPLIRRLTIEAPGTYHHSLIVANLAEAAAIDIKANPHMARACGYYHDIGKLKYPGCFAENITGASPHDRIKPKDSVKIIVSHVEYGITLAEEHRLPQFIKDVIPEHHGDSLIKYFYHKAKEENPDATIAEAEFRYPFKNPQTKESALVMLADGIEASVRAVMAGDNRDSVDLRKMIENMVKGRLTNGSLADSQLTIKDVDTIIESFYRVLKGMYHERIPYPKDPEEEKTAAEAELALEKR